MGRMRGETSKRPQEGTWKQRFCSSRLCPLLGSSLFSFFFFAFFFPLFFFFFFFTQTQRAVFVFLRPCCFVAGKVSTKPGAVCRQQRAAPHHSPAAPHPLPALSPCCTQARACQEHRSCLQNTHVCARALQPHSKSSNSSSKPSHVHVRVFFSPEKLPETCRLQ